jgi:hypothetical protein
MMQDLNQLFEQLKTTNQAGVYLLVSLDTREVYINFASNISRSLVRLLSSQLYFPKFEFNILELVTDPINLRPRCQFYKDLYASNNYVILNPKRVSSWKLRIDTIGHPSDKTYDGLVYAVKVSSGSYKELVVGIYNDYEDLYKFMSSYYPQNLVTRIVYASNDLTREYLKLK